MWWKSSKSHSPKWQLLVFSWYSLFLPYFLHFFRRHFYSTSSTIHVRIANVNSCPDLNFRATTFTWSKHKFCRFQTWNKVIAIYIIWLTRPEETKRNKNLIYWTYLQFYRRQKRWNIVFKDFGNKLTVNKAYYLGLVHLWFHLHKTTKNWKESLKREWGFFI